MSEPRINEILSPWAQRHGLRVSNVYRDPTMGQPNGENDRPAGILVRILALADESTPVKRCGDRGTPASPA